MTSKEKRKLIYEMTRITLMMQAAGTTLLTATGENVNFKHEYNFMGFCWHITNALRTPAGAKMFNLQLEDGKGSIPDRLSPYKGLRNWPELRKYDPISASSTVLSYRLWFDTDIPGTLIRIAILDEILENWKP